MVKRQEDVPGEGREGGFNLIKIFSRKSDNSDSCRSSNGFLGGLIIIKINPCHDVDQKSIQSRIQKWKCEKITSSVHITDETRHRFCEQRIICAMMIGNIFIEPWLQVRNKTEMMRVGFMDPAPHRTELVAISVFEEIKKTIKSPQQENISDQ